MYKLFLSFLTLTIIVNSIKAQLKTYFESSNFLETPDYSKTIEFCRELENKSSLVKYMPIGFSTEEREIPLLILASNKEFTHELAHKSGKIIILIQACIHAGEPDGKDAGLLLIRDFIENKELQKYLDSVIILFIPILNPDGHERFREHSRFNQNGPIKKGERTNALNLNLNRDYLKAQSKEIKSWLVLFHRWQPHFFIDCHVTNGADYQYPITYSLEVNGNMEENITKWLKNKYIKYIENAMKNKGYNLFNYVIFKEWYNFESPLVSYISSPALSQGYAALLNCPSLLIETHMLKDFKTRVMATYHMILETIKLLYTDKFGLLSALKKDYYFFENRPDSLVLTYKLTSDTDHVDFMGYSYTKKYDDTLKTFIFMYNNKEKKTYKKAYLKTFIPDLKVKIPSYYVIPKAWVNIIKPIIDAHSIEYTILDKDTIIEVTKCKINSAKLSCSTYEGFQPVTNFTYSYIRAKENILKGSIIINTQQIRYKIIVHLFDLNAPSSLFKSGFFNNILQPQEYVELYLFKDKINELLKNDIIKEDFQQFMTNNPNASAFEIARWFLFKTEYVDPIFMIYPIFIIY
ncbi:MAG: M14 family metallopeptidase [Bacteroidales bacterium]|nr:M14 family metallopeptidase [Bacteroidales bacterium]